MTSDKLPPGWALATFESLNHYASANVNPADYPEEIFELYSVPNFPTGEPEFQRGSAIGSTKQRVQPDDVLVCKINPRINRVWQVESKGGHTQISSSEWIVFRSPLLCAGFFKYYFRSPEFRQQLSEDVSGVGGSLTRAQPRKVAQYLLPVPPLSEQIRIADQLDALFAEINTAHERLERVPELLKAFREAVLEAAMSGELTRDWRGGEEKSWKRIYFEDVCSEITVGFVGKMSDSYVESGVPFLRSQNVRPFKYDSENLLYISRGFHEELSKSSLKPGDVVVVRSGAPGQCCVIPDDLIEANCSDLIIVRPNGDLDPNYASAFINSSASQEFVKAERVGVAQQHFNVASMKKLPLGLPSMNEQREIVSRLNSYFILADDLQERYKSALSSLNELGPMLLEQAFRGELVAQDPTDEPATELLKRILEAREAENAKRATMTKPRKPRKTPAEEPARSLEQLIERLQKLGGTATPEQLLNAASLRNPEGIEHFFDLLREGRNAKQFSIQPYEDGSTISVALK